MGFFKSGGASLYYEISGEGEPLVFLHGASWDSQMWAEQVSHFSPQFMTVCMDARGHGKSNLPPGKVDSRQFSRDVCSLLDHLNIEKAVICGLSMGGHVALQTAAYYPERVSGLILIGAPFSNTYRFYERFAVPINRFSSRLLPPKTIAKMQANLLSKFTPSVKDYILKAHKSLNYKDWNRVWAAVTRMESEHLLKNIACPVLQLIGDHDSMTNYLQEPMLRRLQNSRIVTIKNAHHATNLDNPTQVNEEIERFIQTLLHSTF
jgi:pimeloyl-ACP methyl ester carboxylesterase